MQGADGALRINAFTGDLSNTAAAPPAVTANHTTREASSAQGNWSVSWSTSACDSEGGKNALLVPKEEDRSRRHDSCSPQSVLMSILSPAAKSSRQWQTNDPVPHHHGSCKASGTGASGISEAKTQSGGKTTSHDATAGKDTCVACYVHHVSSITHSKDGEREVIGRSGMSNSDSPQFGSSQAQGTSDCSSPSSEGNPCVQTKTWPTICCDVVTIKVTCDIDTVRFKFAAEKAYVDLKEEVTRRLNLAGTTFDLQYLDDDEEWMLLACNADLQECVEVMRASQRTAVKLKVRCKSSNDANGTRSCTTDDKSHS